jgi:hypothetical protein
LANRLSQPILQFCDQNGLPYAGGTLSFYLAGTSTPATVYSNSGLSISLGTVVTLDAAGRPNSSGAGGGSGTEVGIFLQVLGYKVTLADVNANLIWTADNVYTSDFSTLAQFAGNAGSPNGVVAGTQASAGVPASVIWDYTNNILYVCTTTGNAAAAVWTAVNPSSASSAVGVSAPQGYLTPTSATPVITTDTTVTAGSPIYYTPYTGNQIPIYNGTVFNMTTFAELQMTMNASNHPADSAFDFFVFNNAGTLTLVTSSAWSTITPGAAARAVAISRLNGFWVNSGSFTGYNGTTSYASIAAQRATYVGSMYTDHSAGAVTCHRSWGQNRKWGIWNAYNRVPVELLVGDATGSFVDSSGSIKASHNTPAAYALLSFNNGSGVTCNGLTTLCGLAEEYIDVRFIQQVASSTGTLIIGIGQNAISAFTGTQGTLVGPSGTMDATVSAQAGIAPALGLNAICCCDQNTGAAGTFLGGQANMVLSATWRG